jgi:hypothetical protein
VKKLLGRSNRGPSLLKLACAAVSIQLISCGAALGTTYTFNGGSVSTPPNVYIPSWSYPPNWVGSAVPSSSNTSDIIFNPFAGNPFAVQDIVDPLNLRSITFNAPYTISGGALRWDVAGSIHNNSNVTFLNPLQLGGTVNQPAQVVYDGSGSALMTNSISGPGYLDWRGPGTLTLVEANSNFGALSLLDGNAVINGGGVTFNLGAYSLDAYGPRNVTLSGGAVVDARAGPIMLAGSGTGSGPTLTVNGAGTMLYAGQVRNGWTGSYVSHIVVEAGASIDTGDLYTASDLDVSTFLVQSGGTATVAHAGLEGDASRGGGVATVTGLGSLWTIKNGLDIGGSNLRINDGGTGVVTVADHGTVVSNGDTKLWGIGRIVLNGGNFTTGSLSGNGTVDTGGPDSNLTINAPAGPGTWIYNGNLTGSGNLIKTGGSIQNLNNASGFNGTVTVNGGTLWMFTGGATSYTANSGGILSLNFYNFGGASLTANPGGTIKYFGTISDATLNGTGNHDISSVSSMALTTLGNDVQIAPTAPLQLLGVTNHGVINNLPNQNLSIGGGSNAADGRMIVSGTADVYQWINNGQINIQAGGALNNSNTPLQLAAGSKTFLGSPAAPGGTLSLGGQTLEVGGLVVNNGTIDGTTNINSGGLVQGAGNFGPINVLAGGKISPGNSPGRLTSGSATWGSNGTFVFEMDDASGTAGDNWDQWNINGNLSITAGSTSSRFVIALNTLGKGGNAAGFIKEENYSWFIAVATLGVTNFDTRRVLIDTSKFINPTSGAFSLSLAGGNLYLNYNASIAPPQWNVDADGSWSTPDKWLPVSAPNGATGLANFLDKITDPHTVTLDGDKTVNTIFFDNIYGYTIAPGSGGTLKIGDGTTGTINVIHGTHTITAPLAFSGNITKTGQGGLTINGPQNHTTGAILTVRRGELNLNSNAGTPATPAAAAVTRLSLTINNLGAVNLGADQDLHELSLNNAIPDRQSLDLHLHAIRVYSSDLALAKTTLYGVLESTLGPGAADFKDGIYDTGTFDNPNYYPIGLARLTDAHGQEMIKIRSTVIGDLNLDGNVSIADFIDLASHFGGTGTWQEGDLNYDGQITISDFIDLAAHFNTSFSGEVWPISPEDERTLAEFAASIVTSVPEPTSLLSLLVSIIPVARRRRHLFCVQH